MPLERDPVHLWDMLQAARGVMHAVHGLTFEQYAADENLRLSVERRVEIIGEAAGRVSEDLRRQHPEIPWRAMIDQRNVLIHAYDNVASERIWRLTFEDLPHLIDQLERLVPTPPAQ
ncbi:MAG TPA: HepT-like ribonuclease domain-containing protein [Thermoanaerobaculia bacterium]|nr:HepT-like ribonuclease domain-containing protein [Thermoanaerobaculia bacterium]